MANGRQYLKDRTLKCMHRETKRPMMRGYRTSIQISQLDNAKQVPLWNLESLACLQMRLWSG